MNTYTCVAEFSQYGAIEALKDREGSLRGWLENSPNAGNSLCGILTSYRVFVASLLKVLSTHGWTFPKRTECGRNLSHHAGRSWRRGHPWRGVWTGRVGLRAFFLRVVKCCSKGSSGKNLACFFRMGSEAGGIVTLARLLETPSLNILATAVDIPH